MQIKSRLEPTLISKIGLSLGAFGLSMLLWVFVVSENEYTMVMDLPIEARNLSVQKAHKEEVPSYASVKIRGAGRDLFKAFILRPFSNFKLVLDLEGISKDYEFILNEYFEKFPQKVVLPLNYNISFVEVVYPNRIKISLDEFRSKNIPVFSNVIFNTHPGFTIVGDKILEPEFIEIAGPEEELALINHLETMADTILVHNGMFEYDIEVKSLGKLINYSNDFIKVKINVQQISERIIVDIPVEILDVPPRIRVFPSPQTVSLTIIGGAKRIATIKSNEIKIQINFKDWNLENQFYEPSVILPFDLLEWRDLSPRNVEVAVARELE